MSTPHSPGRLEQRQRQWVARRDRERAGLVSGRRERRQVLDRTEEVRLLDDDRADAVVERRQFGDPSLSGASTTSMPQPCASVRNVRASGVDALGDDEPLAPAGQLRHVSRRGDCARALVHRGVRDRQSGELGDRRLVLEHRLQAALGDLGLVGRVRGQELRAHDDRVDERRDVVVVHAGAEERHLVLGRDVAGRECPQLVVHLLLGEPFAERQRALQPQPGGDVGEQVLDGADADRLEHLADIGFSGGGVPAQDRVPS